MDRAKITAKDGYRCAPEGHTVVVFAFGEIVTGKVAKCALVDKAASRLFDPREKTKVITPPETKKRKTTKGRK